jgi:uncharacterized UPF0146 family protein
MSDIGTVLASVMLAREYEGMVKAELVERAHAPEVVRFHRNDGTEVEIPTMAVYEAARVVLRASPQVPA